MKLKSKKYNPRLMHFKFFLPAVFFLLVFGNGFSVWALEPDQNLVGSIKAMGVAHFYYKKRTFHFHVAAAISNPLTATLMGYDDFGNNFLKMDMKLNDRDSIDLKIGNHTLVLSPRRFKKLLGIPITPRDFINILLYHPPENREGLLVSYDHFIKQRKLTYPKSLTISSPKTTLKILWKQLQLN